MQESDNENVVGDILLKMMEGRPEATKKARRRCGKSYRGNRKASGNIGEDVGCQDYCEQAEPMETVAKLGKGERQTCKRKHGSM